jgi:hypothetical protein
VTIPVNLIPAYVVPFSRMLQYNPHKNMPRACLGPARFDEGRL